MLDLPTPPPSPLPEKRTLSHPPPNRIGQILAGNIQLTHVLGVGAYGTVYKACSVLDPRIEYAVKALNKSGLDRRQRSFHDREIKLHFEASHNQPGIVDMLQILVSEECTFVVLEYCPEGDLFAKIIGHGQYVGDDQKAKCVFLQILDAVKSCHERGIYHRDLKPENILVKDQGWTVKLADFGLATKAPFTSDFGCGSTFYMSPECQQPNPPANAYYASAPNDVWSLGVILVNLTCGRNPWKHTMLDDSTFRAFVRDRNFLKSILPITDELNYILQRVFELDPRRRISVSELLRLVSACPQFTTTRGTSVAVPPLTFTPPVGAIEKLCLDAGLDYAGATLDIPSMELPQQRYPQPYLSQQQQQCPFPPSPPQSVHNSPHLSPPVPHTYPVRQAAPVVRSPHASPFGFFHPAVSRYGQQFFSTLQGQCTLWPAP